MDQGIGGWISARAMRNGAAVALVDGGSGQRTTYTELEERTNALAGALYRSGVRHGDRVALLATNSPTFLEVVFAVAKAGAVCVPLNFRLSPAELSYILSDSGAATLFVSAGLAKLATAALAGEGVRVTRTIALSTTEEDAHPHESLTAFVDEADADFYGADVSERDLCMIMYTSGTTGRPKGAMLTHSNMLWNAINMISAGEGLLSSDVTLSAAPLFHIGAMGIFTLPLIYLGGTVVTIEQFDPAVTLEIMQRERATVMFLVPVMWSALTRCPEIDTFDPSHLRWVISGGSPCPIPVLEFFGQRGWTLMEGFGLTETAPTCTVLDAEHVLEKAGSIGRAVRHVECRLVDEGDRDVAVGDVGELLLRGRNVFIGYWGLPQQTAQALRGGWFYTGDLGRVDHDGFITLVDRKKDMIISGGENVYPIEVERVLTEHPQVADVAVIGLPDAKWGETVMAVIVPEPDAEVDGPALIEWCRHRLAHFKAPRSIEVVAELPRNATGKLLKRTLREQYTGSTTSLHR